MEANLILRTQHLPAMRHNKNVVVHSSVRLPALQAKVGPPPGSARVAMVGAGVVLACALGAMYWKRAQALPMHLSSLCCHAGKNGNSNVIATKDVDIKALADLLHEICIGTSYSKPPRLTQLLDKCLTNEDREKVGKGQSQTIVLKKFNEAKVAKKIGEYEYYCGLVLILALINEQEYAKAKNICNDLQNFAIPSDPRPKFLLAIINKLMTMKKQSPHTSSTSDLQTMRKLIDEEWEKIRNTGLAGFSGPGAEPPFE